MQRKFMDDDPENNKNAFAFKAHLLANLKYNFPIESD